MIVSTVLVLLLQTGFVLLFALIVGSFAVKNSATRSVVYRLSLVAAIALALASPWLRERPHPVVPVQWTGTPTYTVASAPVKFSSAPVVGHASANVVPEAAHRTPFDPVPYLFAVWLTGAVLLGIRLAIGHVGLVRIQRRCKPIDSTRVDSLLQTIAQRHGIPCPRVVEGSAVTHPFVAGIIRPTCFLPEGWHENAEEGVLSAVLHHEAAHIANRDLRWNLAIRLACIFLWPQPLLWLLQRRMNVASEELCDRYVVAAGISEQRYAEFLLNLQDSVKNSACPAMGIGVASFRSNLGKRVQALLNPRRSQSLVLSRPFLVSLGIGALLLTTSAAFVFAQPVMRGDDTGGMVPRQVKTDSGSNVFTRGATKNWPDDSTPTPPALSFGPGKPFYGPAKLSGGGTATLAYLQVDSSDGHRLWQPDGSPASQTDIDRSLHFVSNPSAVTTGPTAVRKGVRRLFLRVDVDGLERGAYSCAVQVPQKSNWSCWMSYGDDQDRTLDMATFHAPDSLKVTDMRFGIAHGSYRVLESAKIGQAPLFAQAGSGGRVTVHVPKGIQGKEVILAAYDGSGQRLQLEDWETEDTPDKHGALTRSYGFVESAKTIARVELLVRDYEWVTFKGIKLYPTTQQ